ncbi:MAG: ArsR family transcriptional regulator [Chloroflexota bacterium]|nr:MAG: hypothetical protein KatS3mg047_1001 [Bellilinea sp.]
METSTAQQILAYLAENPDSTILQLSRALQVTPADIRYHLSILIRQNLVLPSTTIKSGQRGRPARSYKISYELKPNNIISLARAALSVLLSNSSDNSQKIIQNLAIQLFPEKSNKAGSLTPKIIQLVNHLNMAGYAARWEARPNRPCIIFTNCPYRQLLSQFPALCEMDRFILEYHLDTRIIIEQHIHPEWATPPTCQFSVEVSKK